MNIAVLSNQTPFCYGGAEVLAEDLIAALQARGYQTTLITVPFKWSPQESLLNGMLACKLLDVDGYNGVDIDRAIALKFPAWLMHHPNMAFWILHQHRPAYELWDWELSDLKAMPDGNRVRDMIYREDHRAIAAGQCVYTISQTVSDRLSHYNNLDSAVLYPPPRSMEKFHCSEYGDFLFFPSRITPLKGQELVVEALAHTSSDVKVVFAGEADQASYLEKLKRRAKGLGVSSRAVWLGHISEAEKIDLYSRCAMVLFPTYKEDYGYITPEAMLSSKGVLALDTSGAPLEFIVDGENGSIVENDAQALGQELERLFHDRKTLQRYGENARQTVSQMEISWDKVVESLVQS